MELYLTEKPEVGTHLANVINPNSVKHKGYIDCGQNTIVTWCIGHLLSLKDPEDIDERYKKWSIDQLPMSWGVEYKPNPKTQAQLNTVMRLIRKATTIYCATDIDAAGQAIADEIFEYMGIPTANIKRLLINDNNPVKIAKALNNVQNNSDYQGLYLTEKSRAVADQRVGYNLSRLMTCQAQSQGLKQLFTVGRVQSAVLGLVVRRTRLRKSHIKMTYYNIVGTFNTQVGELKGRYTLPENHMYEVDEKGRINNESQAVQLARSLSGQNAVLKSISTKITHDSPPLPYDLLALQSDAASLYGIPPDECLALTQKLREAPYYAITYNRSDCRYIPDESFNDAPEVIGNLGQLDLFSGLVELTNHQIKSRAFNSSKTGAHGAIIPTGSTEGWEEMPDKLKAVFLLIARNYLIQFIEKRERQVTDYIIDVINDQGVHHEFKGKVQKVVQYGWSVVFRNDLESEVNDDNEDDDIAIEALVAGQIYPNSLVMAQTQETKPPGDYTTASLLRDLKSTAKYIEDERLKKWMLDKDAGGDELGGIGTAATRDSILKGLFDKGFLDRKGPIAKAKILPTPEGELLFDLLPVSLTSPNTTAIWSHYFKQIEQKQMTVEQFWSVVDEFISAEVNKVKISGLAIPQGMKTQGSSTEAERPTATCPLCKQSAIRIKGKNGFFWKCQSCEKIFGDLVGKLFYKQCSRCRSQMRIIKGKGRSKAFIGCTNYPTCQHKEPLDHF
ncbi:DNA topoisomerase [Vibrio sp. 1180_3]|uniref:DNA topoisomerase n=1 Tax=Vibrio sp. 1180_3 TaxID=2528832 RepID=UPI002405A58E|nr:DNA topoisomerase [Vibrio sp. 1180_3]MDF9399145.1 hypothetical protein [Vibrio sp. 1180_3]